MVLRAWGDVCIDSISHGFEKAGITLFNTDLPIPEPEIPGSDKRPDDAPKVPKNILIDLNLKTMSRTLRFLSSHDCLNL